MNPPKEMTMHSAMHHKCIFGISSQKNSEENIYLCVVIMQNM